MISDGRYLMSALSPGRFWRYDRKWRRRLQVGMFGDQAIEGTTAFVVVTSEDDAVLAYVFAPDQPDVVVASGRFDGEWSFDLDRTGWGRVPEHILVDWKGKRGLLRIADGAEVDPLVDVPEPTTVTHVPESRLVVLAGNGAVTVYDPKARHAGVRLKLSGNTKNPVVRFRDGDKELWVNDGPTLIKFETANWQVIDAAESQSENAPAITQWDFSLDEQRVLILRENEANVVIGDALTLEEIDTFLLKSIPVDVIEATDGKIFAVDATGKLPQARRKR